MGQRICQCAQNCFGPYCPEWKRPVEDLILYCKSKEVDCEELKQANDEAYTAYQRVKEVTGRTVNMFKFRTCLETQVPLHVDDESARVKARQSLDGLDVVRDEVELLAGI